MSCGKKVRVRFAPSPTGHLHIGNFRVAVFNWLFAQHNDGLFLVRIEDTDPERSKKEYADEMLQVLDWVGITPDEPVIKQSDRFDEYKQYVQKLLEEGKAYRCFCTPQEVEKRQQQKGLDPKIASYDRFCRDCEIDNDKANDRPYVVRFKIPRDVKSVTFNDLIRGEITFDTDQLDDFIIQRSDGSPTYNFVVVIDDHDMGVTQVMRGEDHISNTPKQILLYQALGFEIPEFAHLPLILGKSGEKLSKRDATTAVLDYRKNGYLPDALVNYLVRLGWSHGDQEIFTQKELIDYFTLDHVGKKGAIFDTDKLDWLNSVYMQQADNKTLFTTMVSVVESEFCTKVSGWSTKQVFELIELYKQRTKTIRELADELLKLYNIPREYNEAALQKWIRPESTTYIKTLIDRLELQEDFSSDALTSMIKALCDELSIKLVKLAQPIRIALTGSSASPGIFELLSILGKKESLVRLQTFLTFLENK